MDPQVPRAANRAVTWSKRGRGGGGGGGQENRKTRTRGTARVHARNTGTWAPRTSHSCSRDHVDSADTSSAWRTAGPARYNCDAGNDPRRCTVRRAGEDGGDRTARCGWQRVGRGSGGMRRTVSASWMPAMCFPDRTEPCPRRMRWARAGDPRCSARASPSQLRAKMLTGS